MRVCHIVPSLEHRHGGPSKSVRALANATAALGVPTALLTTLEPGQEIAAAHDLASLQVFSRDQPRWLCPSRGLRDHLGTHDYDCVHHHGLWLRTLHYAHAASRRTGAPLVISPRGMMSGWAYEHHRTRKRLAGALVHPRALTGASGWHATSDDEADAIRRLGFTQPICVAPNGVELPGDDELRAARDAWHERLPQLRNRRVALFYSRLHRKKRVRELLELWTSAPRGDWLLLIVGVPEEYSVAEIESWITAARAEKEVVVADGTTAPPPFAAAELFLLPSHSENFGLVVAEALAAGVPTLVTDTTPWRELAERAAGWCVPWENFGVALRDAIETNAAALRQMGAAGHAWVGRQFTWERSARRLIDFYHSFPHA